jgi:hypothetical protein
MSTEPRRGARGAPLNDLDATVSELVEACDGDATAALRVLVVAYEHSQEELATKEAEVAQLVTEVSRGYSRCRWKVPRAPASGD